MGKPSVVSQLTIGQLSLPSSWVDKWVVSCNQMAAIISRWWRRLVNAYAVKAGMVYLQCKTVWSIPERFRCELFTMDGALYKSIFLCLGLTSFTTRQFEDNMVNGHSLINVYYTACSEQHTRKSIKWLNAALRDTEKVSECCQTAIDIPRMRT